MRYHKKFQHFKPQALTITKSLLKDWGNCSDDLRLLKMNKWLTEAAELYQIARPDLIKDVGAGEGCYLIVENQIRVSKESVVTLLHEFRHALQTHRRASGFSYNPLRVETDARAWSLSLYYKVAPRSFRRLVTEGAIYHISVNDLTRG